MHVTGRRGKRGDITMFGEPDDFPYSFQFNAFRLDRSRRRGGGVALYVWHTICLELLSRRSNIRDPLGESRQQRVRVSTLQPSKIDLHVIVAGELYWSLCRGDNSWLPLIACSTTRRRSESTARQRRSGTDGIDADRASINQWHQHSDSFCSVATSLLN